MATVDFIGVEKTYPNGHKAIHGIDLNIADGEFVVLVGPSGCGKSTLLRMLAGLETVTGGEIRIDGKVINRLEPADRDIAMVFQNYALYPHMSVRENMAYGLRNRKTPMDVIEKRVAEAAKVLGLEGMLDRKPKQLSGGQRQRVAMGRAIVREPKAFLFDEPLSNLDAKLRVQMRVEIRRLQRELNTTAIYVTHDQVEAMTMADRLVVMRDGVAQQIGRPLDVYAKPRTTYVAAFIGSPGMNLLEGVISADGSAVVLGKNGAMGRSIALPVARPGETGRPVVLGIRPEHLLINPQQGETIEVRSVLTEPLGADTIKYTTLPGCGQSLTVRLPGTHPSGDTDVLTVGFDPAHLHLFDEATGLRLED
ncbi:sn-glycerol-3-phosphate import ATP-binding protein UgpC [Novispirillum itersonii]|uniref:sn-glycerol 3-phosphate transport system ATP-binding protein n=1 Tax=Novispirillum itersonii TaxID=189 RepID=A0A7W9ZDU7_NOVIT|nr:sn-glycerol-3-phosphate import ATP-binding protein UgpC [Novispirillum itersonii]MBB6209678.1 sn-glycerol 3-phosphate transport system ATP-binding protein [Novispirillum itersonii]